MTAHYDATVRQVFPVQLQHDLASVEATYKKLIDGLNDGTIRVEPQMRDGRIVGMSYVSTIQHRETQLTGDTANKIADALGLSKDIYRCVIDLDWRKGGKFTVTFDQHVTEKQGQAVAVVIDAARPDLDMPPKVLEGP